MVLGAPHVLVLVIDLLHTGKPIGAKGWIGCVVAISFAMLYSMARRAEK